jgi:hypothetical protein
LINCRVESGEESAGNPSPCLGFDCPGGRGGDRVVRRCRACRTSGHGLIVETTPAGKQIATKLLDKSGSPPGAGALFGLAVAPNQAGLYYVDDAVNTLRLLH